MDFRCFMVMQEVVETGDQALGAMSRQPEPVRTDTAFSPARMVSPGREMPEIDGMEQSVLGCGLLREQVLSCLLNIAVRKRACFMQAGHHVYRRLPDFMKSKHYYY